MGSIAAASYGLNPLFALPLYKSGMMVDSVLFFRYLFAILMLGIMLRLQGVPMRVRRCEVVPLVAFGLLFSASSLFLFLSYNHMDAGIASTILFMYPVMVAVIMGLFFHEKFSWLTWLCMLMALMGIVLLGKTGDGTPISLLGVAFVMLSSLSYALYIVGVNHSAVKEMNTPKLTFYVLLAGITIYVVRLDFLTSLQFPSSPTDWLCAFCLALFPTIISLVTMTISIHHIGSTYAAILGALEPITALVVGTLVFHEVITPRMFVGIVLILMAVSLLVAGKKLYYAIRQLLPLKER